MATHTITSEPKASARLQGWDYAYFDKATASGGQCVAVFSPALRGIVKKGFQFHEDSLRFDSSLSASVLELDFHEPQNMEGPSIPPNLEEGWGDPDSPLATVVPITGGNGHRSPIKQYRESRAAALENAKPHLDADLFRLTTEVNRVFCTHFNLLTQLGDKDKAFVAQKLTATTLIPWYRAKGVSLNEQDIAAMSF